MLASLEHKINKKDELALTTNYVHSHHIMLVNVQSQLIQHQPSKYVPTF